MKRVLPAAIALVVLCCISGCSTKQSLAREDRDERLRDDARHAEEQRSLRTQAARSQLQYEGTTKPATKPL